MKNQRGTKTVLIPKVAGAMDDIGDHVYPVTGVRSWEDENVLMEMTSCQNGFR